MFEHNLKSSIFGASLFRCVTLLCLLFCLTGCSYFKVDVPLTAPEDEKILVFDGNSGLSSIVWDLATQLKYDKRLHIEQAFMCVGPNHYTLHLQFSTQALLEMCDARHLLVHVVEGYLNAINSSGVSAEFGNEPMTEFNLDISIDFESFHGVYVDPFFIGSIKLQKGMAYYYAFNVKDRDADHWHSRYEAYFQSREFSKKQQEAEAKYKKSNTIHRPVLKEQYIPFEEEKKDIVRMQVTS